MSVGDDYFGPQMRGYFDFTVLFEQSILSILPSALFILLVPVRIISLLRNGIRVRSGKLLWLKLRSVRPSLLLGGYLVLTIVLDTAHARTLWIRDGLTPIAGVFTASLAIKAVMLMLEETPKRGYLPDSEKDVAVECTTGVVSRSLFWWLNGLFFQGFRLLIGLEDLGPIDPKFDSTVLLGRLDRVWSRGKSDTCLSAAHQRGKGKKVKLITEYPAAKNSKWSLIRSVFWAYRTTFLAAVLPRILFAGFIFSQPFLVNQIVNFVGSPRTEDSKNVAGGLVGATACWYQHMTFQLVTLFRGGLISLIFKKTLSLDASVIKDSAPVTLMSVDIENIAVSMTFIHDVWAAAIELPVGVYLLYRQVGPPCFLLLIPGLVCTALTTKLSTRMAPARVAWNQGVQKRVSITSSMLTQIKGIKMMGLTDHFSDIIQKLRVSELKLSTKFRILVTILSVIVIIAAAVFWTRAEQGLTIAEAFTALSIIVLVSQPLIKLISSIMQLMGAFGCFTRIQEFLLLDEIIDQRQIIAGSTKASLDSGRALPSIFHGGSDLQPLTSRAIQLANGNEIELGSLRGTGRSSVASGNTNKPVVTVSDATLVLKDGTEILKNVSLTLRQTTISMLVGRVGCGKSSLLKAILGETGISTGSTTLHTSSVAFCDQSAWLRNVSIKANIIGQTPFDQAWFSAVVHACALDEDIALFPEAEDTIVGTGGVALSGGQKQRVALARAVYSRRKLLLLDDVFSGLDNSTSKAVFRRLLGPDGLLRQVGMTVFLATNHVNFLRSADYITMIQDGIILHNQISFDSIPRSAWGHLVEEEAKGKDSEEHVEPTEGFAKDSKPTRADRPVAVASGATEAELTRQTGDTECYRMYLNSIGWPILIVFLILNVLFVAFTKMPQIWLRIWTEHGTNDRPAMHFGIYVMFGLICIVLNGVALGAPLYFFTTTDSGVTLNRFSQDMALIDHRLPISAWATIHSFLTVLAETAIIATGSSYIAALIPPSFLALYLLQKYYLRTSRQLRHIDLEAKSPLFTHFSEVLAGLPTIRAFAWSPAMLRENHTLLDASQRPYYLFFCVQRWLNVVLDLFIAGMAVVLVAFALYFTNATTMGAIGLAMVNIINFNQTLGDFIEMWTMLETSLGAIARLKYFVRYTPREDRDGETDKMPPAWPGSGEIEIENVTAAYRDETDPIIRNVSLTIQPGQKVGICGRSGSGKSSLLLTLLRLLDLKHEEEEGEEGRGGDLRIASHSLLTLPRSAIRTSLTTLPQDPVLLPGTVRENLDPGAHTPDADLISVLRKMKVWELIEARGGLGAEMSATGLSAGQKQLFCLARAVLKTHSRGAGIVLLDEATSNVDHATDEEVRKVLDEEFGEAGVTVVEVAHRLEAIVGYDVVVVMHEGRVVESQAM
ncbi:uncharacterized protein N0V96_011260 [Colletotrichum fioriniae]|uniref:uncharacterized protein n=1 Tax=Colletotrichum fioriniae TaxID=710243 RepID=UPI0032DB9956|nr:hypothetical protein N0V96_011260 [Colletotrichum fioriniae]